MSLLLISELLCLESNTSKLQYSDLYVKNGTPQHVLNQVILNPEEVLVVGRGRDSWQEVPIDQQYIYHPIVSCEKWMIIQIQREEGVRQHRQ